MLGLKNGKIVWLMLVYLRITKYLDIQDVNIIQFRTVIIKKKIPNCNISKLIENTL